MHSTALRALYRANAKSYERTAARAESELSALRQIARPDDKPRIDSLIELIEDARLAARDLRRILGGG